MGKHPLYLSALAPPPGITTFEITIDAPVTAFGTGALSVTVTRFPDSLIPAMPDDANCPVPTFGRVNVTGLFRPVAVVLSTAGVNDVMTSTPLHGSPAAFATKTRELLGRMAACVGFTPMLATPMLESPETSI